MCQGLSHFSGFLHHYVLATNSIRVKDHCRQADNLWKRSSMPSVPTKHPELTQVTGNFLPCLKAESISGSCAGAKIIDTHGSQK